MEAGHHHDEHDHTHGGFADRLRRIIGHRHDHDSGALIDTGEQGIRATKVSLVGLGITALLQAVIVIISGSVALLSDTLHNLTDALTAVPLWIAFSMSRRSANDRFTTGYHRLEDLAGVIIVAAIALSAVGVIAESTRRLFDLRDMDQAGLVVAAGLIGALGNELVARYRIAVGHRIGSEALVADGHHARTDALTSLAVVVAGVGALAEVRWLDPAAGLLVGLMILVLLRRSAARIFGRLIDAVDPDLVARVRRAAARIAGVESVGATTLRWQGHRLLATVSVAVDPGLTIRQGHDIGEEVHHEIHHEFPLVVETLVHVDPADSDDAHSMSDHHHPPRR